MGADVASGLAVAVIAGALATTTGAAKGTPFKVALLLDIAADAGVMAGVAEIIVALAGVEVEGTEGVAVANAAAVAVATLVGTLGAGATTAALAGIEGAVAGPAGRLTPNGVEDV